MWTTSRWDLTTDTVYHGNYQVAKSWTAVSKYVQKDGNFIANIDVESAEAKKGKKNMDILKMSTKEAIESGKITWQQGFTHKKVKELMEAVETEA